MKKMFVVLMSFALAVGAMAQTNETTDKKTAQKERRKALDAKLQLTDEQKASMKKIQEEQKKKRADINSDQSLTPAQKETAVKDLRKEGAQKMEGVLTDEQRKIAQQERKEFRKERGLKNRRNP